MDEQSILSAIARLEALATKYGPSVTSIVSTVADNLSGPGPISGSTNGVQAQPVAAHLGARLHSVAGVLEGLFGTIEATASRAATAIGAA